MFPISLRAAWLAVAGGLCVMLACGGCQNGTFQPPGGATAPATSGVFQQQAQSLASQVQDLNRRVSQLDLNNADLHRQLAQAEQQRQTVAGPGGAAAKAAGEVAKQLEDTQLAKQEADKQVERPAGLDEFRGGATITANNSVRQSLATVAIPGLEIRQDGEVIRIEIPGDKLFVPGRPSCKPTATAFWTRSPPPSAHAIRGSGSSSKATPTTRLAGNPTAAHALTSAAGPGRLQPARAARPPARPAALRPGHGRQPPARQQRHSRRQSQEPPRRDRGLSRLAVG